MYKSHISCESVTFKFRFYRCKIFVTFVYVSVSITQIVFYASTNYLENDAKQYAPIAH